MSFSLNELIDTLWNVNMEIQFFLLMQVPELIDTLWNVNEKSFSHKCGRRFRINRYIMECKLAMIVVIIITDRDELIDTLWNVNISFRYASTFGFRN